jgi:hypothetical protein
LIWRIWRNEVAEQREDRNGRVPGLHDGVWQSLFLEARVIRLTNKVLERRSYWLKTEI